MKVNADGKVTLYGVDGSVHTHWPVDARAMLEQGGYTTDPSSDNAVTVTVPPEQSVVLKAGDIGPTGAPVVIGPAVVGEAKAAGSVAASAIPTAPVVAPRSTGRKR